MSGKDAIYVYGVVAGATPLSLPAEGVTGAATRLVESDGLAAVVSDVPAERFRVRRSDLHAHLRALDEVFRQTTVVPCRFGMVLSSEGDVRSHLLETRRDELRGLLDHLADRVQLNMKAAYDEPEVLRQVVASEPRIAQARQRALNLGDAAYYQNIRLGELVAERIEARRHDDTSRVLSRLEPLAVDVTADDAEALFVLKASFLVERRSLDRFDAEVESLAGEAAPTIRFELVGPLPPTAFATLGAGEG